MPTSAGCGRLRCRPRARRSGPLQRSIAQAVHEINRDQPVSDVLTLDPIKEESAASLLFGVGARDPLTMGGAAAILGAVAFLACYIPARRAAKLDSLVALREM